jgi:hypothetical protein
MAAIEWQRITPDEFEDLCFSLLGKLNFQNRDWREGLVDGTRDISATTFIQEIPGHQKELKWFIECRANSGQTLTSDDLRQSVDALRIAKPERYLLMTTATLAPRTKRWLLAQFESEDRIQYIEAPELEELLERHLPQRYSQLKDYSSSTAVASDTCRRLISDKLRRFVDLKLLGSKREMADLFSGLDMFRDGGGRLPLKQQTVSLDEVHHIIYHADGMCTTHYRITILNLGRPPVEYDTFRLYGDEPVFDNTTLELSGNRFPEGQGLSTHVQFDTGHIKLVEFTLGAGITLYDTCTYEFSVRWPYPAPLTGQRYYSTYGRRAKGRVKVMIDLPRGRRLDDTMLLLSSEGVPRRVIGRQEIVSERHFSVEYAHLDYGELFQVVFGVSEVQSG